MHLKYLLCKKYHPKTFVWLFIFGFAFLGAIINGSYVVLISESFPAHLRYSGVGFSYSLGIALFGGIAPLIFSQLIVTLKSPEAPALYLFVCACFTLFAIIQTDHPEKKRQLLSENHGNTHLK
ncbi:major facilitator family transporter [Legionella wadsworthii]|uniref:Major facilitator family transporter n=1 Tax=Legionella wadsworthii TaxID=28088 RepID=A0A378LMI7_9GAMM|nr:MFS transporter [Legionella wadsworthii]STY28225.1 major facilitator family transporter [Legionella wadsworthii]